MSKRWSPSIFGEYLCAKLFIFLSLALPLRAALRFGEIAGDIGAMYTGKRRREAVANVRHAFPGISEEGAERIVRRAYRHFFRASVETIRAPRIIRPHNCSKCIRIRHEDRVNRVIAEGKGAIWITAHVGVWELFAMVQAFKGVRISSVYRPVKNPLIDRMLRRHRSELGQKMISRKGALKSLIRTLRNRHGHVALLVDQHAKRDGVWVPFFGRLASTTPAPALLALRTGAPIVLWYSRRLPGTFRFEAFVDEPFTVISSGDRAADIERVTRHISDRLEQFIRTCPEQWLWFHRRWRTPPPEVLERERSEREESHAGSSVQPA